MKKACIIGLGLIGGSFAKALRTHRLYDHIIGIDASQSNCDKASDLQIVDQCVTVDTLPEVDLVVVCTPVSTLAQIVNDVLESTSAHTLVLDMGSTKKSVCDAVKHSPHRHRYVACHPIAGTEFSGPEAAVDGLFEHKKMILCEKEKSDPKMLSIAQSIFSTMGMTIVHMPPDEHDTHAAYVSHLSHVTSFVLSRVVLEIEKKEKAIFDMAGSGFESTVRLAKSSQTTWSNIFIENKKALTNSIDHYIHQINELKTAIERDDDAFIRNFIDEANKIATVLTGKQN